MSGALYSPAFMNRQLDANAAARGGMPSVSARQWDQRMRNFGGGILDAATTAAGTPGPGMHPWMQQSGTFFGNVVGGAGQQGINALAGDPRAVQQLMNPYTQQVIDANAQDWQRMNQAGTTALNAQATATRAFGGSRHGIAQGQMLASNASNEAQQAAMLRSAGFSEAMGRAGSLAGLGMQGAGALAGLGEAGRNIDLQTRPDLWRLAIMQQGMSGLPFTSGQIPTSGGNRFLGALGGGITGFLTGGPLGAVGGAIAGAAR
jgi:hypothetical protein